MPCRPGLKGQAGALRWPVRRAKRKGERNSPLQGVPGGKNPEGTQRPLRSPNHILAIQLPPR